MTRQTPRQALAENKSLLKWRPPLDRWQPWRSALVALLDQVSAKLLNLLDDDGIQRGVSPDLQKAFVI